MGLGAILLERGVISQQQLDAALAEQRSGVTGPGSSGDPHGERLDRVLVRMGMATSEQILTVIGDQFHMPVVDLNAVEVKPDVLRALPAKLVYRQNCVPIDRRGSSLVVATSDPFELTGLEELKLLTGCAIQVVLADEQELRKFIRTHYGVAGDTLDELDAARPAANHSAEIDTAAEIEQAQEASVIRLVNDLLVEAVSERATDVHIEPYERSLAVRYRIDGVLQRANLPPTINSFGPAIVSRLKIMASLNIAEKRRPQDGRISLRIKGHELDLRVSVIPMLFGEGVVLRVLNKSAVLLGLPELGMPPGVLGSWRSLIARPHGILLVTGPTGSGKSTTLYASLNEIVSDEIKAVTIEDPVEYHLAGVNQIQVNHKLGVDFGAGLRSVLRHDPDVILVGEIRDRETADVAVQASLTGHLVFSTLHTNDAAGAPARLLDMGVEPFLVASSVEGVLAQRLVRRLCTDCRRPFDGQPAELPPDLAAQGGQGIYIACTAKRAGVPACRTCRGTGYRGRVGIYELLGLAAPELRELIVARSPGPRLAAAAVRLGELRALQADALQKVREGLTSVDEVLSALAG